jgi:hypothetical protein
VAVDSAGRSVGRDDDLRLVAASRPVTQAPAPSRPAPRPGGTASFGTPGGYLVVRCVGAKLDGWQVRPADGWRADLEPGGRSALRAVFRRAEGPLIEVRALCRDGNPSFVARPQRA